MPDPEALPDDAETDPSDRAVTLDAEAILRKLGGRTTAQATTPRPSENPAADPAIRPEISIPGGSTYAVAATVPDPEDGNAPVEASPSGFGRPEDRASTPEVGRLNAGRDDASRVVCSPEDDHARALR